MNLNIINHFLIKKVFIFLYIFIFIYLSMNLLKNSLPQESINYLNKDFKKQELSNFYIIEENKVENKDNFKEISKNNFSFDNLIIKGKIIDNKRKIVIIENKINNKSYIVKENDVFENGIKIVEINTNEIIVLDNKNIKHTIKFDLKNKNDKHIALSRNELQIEKINKTKNEKLLDVNNLSLVKPKKYASMKFIDKNEILKYKDNFQKVFEEISFKEMKNENNLFFQIEYLKEESFFHKILELEKNDIIEEINNEKINDYSKLMFFFNNIENLDKIELKLKRNNSIHNKTFEFK